MTLVALLMLAILPQAAAPPTDAGLSAESLAKLRKVALSASKATNLDAPVVKMLGLGKDGDTISVKQLKADTANGRYVLTVPVKAGSDDVLFSFRDPSGVTFTYLSDSRRMLRAAMASDSDGNHPLTNDEAAEGFRSSLKAWGLIAPRVKNP
jgi:hypothetical protein